MRFVLFLLSVAILASACSSDGAPDSDDASTPTTRSTTVPSVPDPTATTVPTQTPTPEPQYGPNLLTNGGFEDGSLVATGWSPPTELEDGQSVEWTSEDAFSGNRSLKLASPGTANDWVRVLFGERIIIDPNASYLLTVRVRTENGAVFWSGWAYFETDSAVGSDASGSSGQITVTEAEWTELKALVVPRGNLDYLQLDLTLAVLPDRVGLDPGEQMVLYIDDVSLREVLDQ